MSSRIATTDGEVSPFRRTFRYDARTHYAWVRAELESLDVSNPPLARLRDEGYRSHQVGLPWRELAPHEVEVLGANPERARKYAGRARRRIESLLPPRLKPLVALIVLDLRQTLEVEIGSSRALRPEQIDDLQDLCRRRHRGGESLSSAERERLARRLAYIDPVNARFFAALAPGFFASDLANAAVNATAAASGSWQIVGSVAGYLPVGKAEPVGDGRVAVEPTFRFTRGV